MTPFSPQALAALAQVYALLCELARRAREQPR